MNSGRSNNISLKYQRFTTLSSKDIQFINSEFVAKTQFLWLRFAQIFGAEVGWLNLYFSLKLKDYGIIHIL